MGYQQIPASAKQEIDGEGVTKVVDQSSGETPYDSETTAFKKVSYASELKNINKGSKNKITVQPNVLIENMIDDTNMIKELGAGSVTDVGQVFRLTGGIMNIDQVRLTMEAIAGGAILLVDDFESYADTAALIAVWVPNDTSNTPASLETSITAEGSQAIKVAPSSNQKSKNDEIVRTYGSDQDWSGHDGIQFMFRRDATYTIEIRIEDSSGNISKHSISTSSTGAYEFIQLDFADFLPVTAGPADFSIVEKISFRQIQGGTVPWYVDIIELFSAQSFGTVDIELRDFGTDSSPTTLGTLLGTDTISLSSGQQIYQAHFSEGSLTPNNYYGIIVTNASVATVKVYGKTGSNLYSNGFSFSSTDDLNITATGSGQDLYFLTFALDKAIFNGIRIVANAEMGESEFNAFINNNASGKGKTALFLGENLLGRKEVNFPTAEDTNVIVKMGADELIFIEFVDDSGSSATKVNFTAYFTFIERSLNG